MIARKKVRRRGIPDHLPGGYLLPSRMKSLLPGNDVKILINGTDFFPSIIDTLGSARESIYMDFYRISDDKTGNLIGEIISEKARRGVEVCVIYDDIGSFASGEFFKWLNSSGVRTSVFNPVSLFRSKLGINRRDHRKMIIVDGAVGYLGGLNIAEVYGHPEKDWAGWRDTAVKIEGPVIKQMVSIFLRSWKKLGGEPLECPKKYIQDNRSAAERRSGTVCASVAGTEKIRRRWEITNAYRKALWKAKYSIYIQSSYFLPPFSMRRALRRAVQRGVSVKIIVPLQGDVMMSHYASRRLFNRLLKAGVQLYQLPGPTMHAKTAVIDGVWSTVGSFNQNHRSFFHDFDINLFVVDETFGAKMEKSFIEDLSKTIPVDLRKWRERPLNEKIVERFCYTLRHWL